MWNEGSVLSRKYQASKMVSDNDNGKAACFSSETFHFLRENGYRGSLVARLCANADIDSSTSECLDFRILAITIELKRNESIHMQIHIVCGRLVSFQLVATKIKSEYVYGSSNLAFDFLPRLQRRHVNSLTRLRTLYSDTRRLGIVQTKLKRARPRRKIEFRRTNNRFSAKFQPLRCLYRESKKYLC